MPDDEVIRISEKNADDYAIFFYPFHKIGHLFVDIIKVL